MFPKRLLHTIRCPNCQETIDSESTDCRFCHAQIDPVNAAAEAAVQTKVNHACSEAAYLESAGVVMFAFLFLTWFHLLYLFFWGFLATFVLVPVLLVRWQIRFSRIDSDDSDLKKARRSRTIAFALWLTAAVLAFAPVLDDVIANRHRLP